MKMETTREKKSKEWIFSRFRLRAERENLEKLLNLKNLSMGDLEEILDSLVSSNESPYYVEPNSNPQEFINDLIQVVKMVGNETKSAFTKLKFLVDGFETDKREELSFYRKSEKQRYHSPAEFTKNDKFYVEYGEDCIGTNLSSESYEGFLYTILSGDSAQYLVFEVCVQKDGIDVYITNEDGLNRINIYTAILGKDGNGIDFLKVSNNKITSVFSREFFNTFDAKRKENPEIVPNIHKIEELFIKKIESIKKDESNSLNKDKEISKWCKLSLNNLRELNSEKNNNDLEKAISLMENSKCEIRLGQSNSTIQRYMYRVRSKHNSPFTHAQEAIEGLQSELGWKKFEKSIQDEVFEAALDWVMHEVSFNKKRAEKFFGSDLIKELSFGKNYDTKEVNQILSLIYASLDFKGIGQKKERYNLLTNGDSFKASKSGNETPFNLINKAIAGRSMCEAQKELEDAIYQDQSSSESLKREFIVRAKNMCKIIRAITHNKYSVLEMIETLQIKLQEKVITKSPQKVKLTQLHSQNWFFSLLMMSINVAISQNYIELKNSREIRTAIICILSWLTPEEDETSIKKEGSNIKNIIEVLNCNEDKELRGNFADEAKTQNLKIELLHSDDRWNLINEKGDSYFGLGTVKWVKFVYCVMWRVYMPELVKESKNNCSNQAEAQKICDEILKYGWMIGDYYYVAFLDDKNNIRIVKFTKESLREITLGVYDLNVEHNIQQILLGFHPFLNPPRLGDSKANNTDNQSLRDPFANVYLRNRAIKSLKIEDTQFDDDKLFTQIKRSLITNDEVRFEAELGQYKVKYSEVLQRGEELDILCERTNDNVTDENAETAMEEFIWKKWFPERQFPTEEG